MHAAEGSRAVVAVAGQVQDAVDDVERELGARGGEQARAGGAARCGDTGAGEGDSGADDDLTIQQAAAPVGAEVKRQHVRGVRAVEIFLVQCAHRRVADDDDREPTGAKALGGRGMAGGAGKKGGGAPGAAQAPGHGHLQSRGHVQQR